MTMNGKTRMIIHLSGILIAAVLIALMFVPYYPPVKFSASVGTGLEKVTEIKQDSMIDYALRPTEDYAKNLNSYFIRYEEGAQDYGESDGTRTDFITREAVPVIVLFAMNVITVALSVWKIRTCVPGIVLMLDGIAGVWAFLCAPVLLAGGVLAYVILALYVLLLLAGFALTLCWYASLAGKKDAGPLSLACAALVALIILFVFPVSFTETGVMFDVNTVGATALNAQPDYSGLNLCVRPVFVLGICAASLIALLLVREWKFSWAISLVSGVWTLCMLLVNRTYYGSASALELGMAASMLLIAVSLLRALKTLLSGKNA